MLRIAKTSPGVLDLSAVNDEFGLPVILNGPSHRDVPDHEESNPVLQRVVAVQWVTLTRVPVDAPVDDPAQDPGDPEAPNSTPEPPIVIGDPESPEDPETTSPSAPAETQIVDDNPPNAPDGVDAQPSEDVAVTDTSVKPEGFNKPSGKSDTRKTGRRS